MKYTPDVIDQKIISTILSDARMSTSDLADKVGLSRPAVAERIEKLERLGFIKGYTAVVKGEPFEKPIVAFVAARHTGFFGSKFEASVHELSLRPEILEVHGVAGEDCLYLKVRVKDMQELNGLVKELQRKPLQMQTKTTIVMNTYFEKHGGILVSGKIKKG